MDTQHAYQRDVEALSTPLTSLATLQRQVLNMVNYSVSQEWPYASEISLLQSEILKKESDFPDPASYYSLYCVIINKENLNRRIGHPFTPFKGRASVQEILKEDGRDGEICKDYGFWIDMSQDFLRGPPLVEHKKDGKGGGQLTSFGKHMFPELMSGFACLYRQNIRLRNTVLAYRPPEV